MTARPSSSKTSTTYRPAGPATPICSLNASWLSSTGADHRPRPPRSSRQKRAPGSATGLLFEVDIEVESAELRRLLVEVRVLRCELALIVTAAIRWVQVDGSDRQSEQRRRGAAPQV